MPIASHQKDALRSIGCDVLPEEWAGLPSFIGTCPTAIFRSDDEDEVWDFFWNYQLERGALVDQ